jgi:hypothetical protein
MGLACMTPSGSHSILRYELPSNLQRNSMGPAAAAADPAAGAAAAASEDSEDREAVEADAAAAAAGTRRDARTLCTRRQSRAHKDGT